jgi:hypothetical protein
VRVLVALKSRLAVLLQFRNEGVAAGRVALGDHERLDLREALDPDADHRTLRDRRVLEERRFDLDRRNP